VDGSWIPFPTGHGGHQHCIRQIDWAASHGWIDDSTENHENSEEGIEMTTIDSTTTFSDDTDANDDPDPDGVLYLAAWLYDVVEVDYKSCHLVLQPDAIGWQADGEYVVHAYQVGGQSPVSGPAQRWQCLRVGDLSNIRLSDRQWQWVPPDAATPCVEDSTDPPDYLIGAPEDQKAGGHGIDD
jgi:hypothetical protein